MQKRRIYIFLMTSGRAGKTARPRLQGTMPPLPLIIQTAQVLRCYKYNEHRFGIGRRLGRKLNSSAF